MVTPTPGASGPTTLRRVARALPSAVVFALLGGVAYWGHRTSWTFTGSSGGPDSSVADVTFPNPVVRLVPNDGQIGEALARIEFDSAVAAERAGIDVAPVWTAAFTEEVAGAGEVRFDPSRIARVAPRAGGVARRVLKAAGDPVRAGETLAVIESAEVGKATAEFQQALVQARHRTAARDDLAGAKAAGPPAAVREAEAAVREADVRVLAAAQALTNLGLPVEPNEYRTRSPAAVAKKLRDLTPGDAANLLPVRSPLAGVVLSADVVAGEVIEAGKAAFVVVDARRVWVTLNVRPEDAHRVAVGQQVYFRPDGGTAEAPAAVVWVGAAADEATRTVPVRAEADNAAGALRAGVLGRGRVVLRHEPEAIVVPNQAVRRLGDTPVVFVRDPDFLKPGGTKAFVARAVRVGGSDERNTEILAGAAPGEVVAVKGGDVFHQLVRSANPTR